MFKYFKITLICLLTLIAASSAFAVILHVPIEYTTIQSAIDAAADGDTVLIRPDIYYENIDFDGKNITVGSYLITTGSDAFVYSTIIDGADSGPAVTFDGREDNTAVLYGLTIRNGSGKEVENYNHTMTNIYGGGIYISYSSPTIRSNVITLNKVYLSAGNCHGYGGGIYCESSEAIILDNIISKNEGYRLSDPNTCSSEGGGIYCMESDVLIKGNTIFENTAKFGAGVALFISDALVEDNEIRQNQAFSIAVGAGIMCAGYSDSYAHPIIRNNVIKENEGYFGSGICCLTSNARIEGNFIYDNTYDAIACQQGNDTIVNNTIYNNNGPALNSSNYANPLLMNNILWNNNHYGDEIITSAPGEPSITCCLVMGGWPGAGNIDADPQFCNLEAHDFTLNVYSPCLPENNDCGVLMGAVDDVACYYMCGDANGDELLTIEDVMYLLDYYFAGGAALSNNNMLDLNHNGDIDLADIVFMAYYVYAIGPEPWCAGFSPDAW